MPEVKASKGILGSTKLHVEDFGGEGRPVVLIHGWPLSSYSWKEQIPALTEAGCRVITYDRRGFGASDKSHKGYDYDTLADDLQAVLTELDVHNAMLVGFSMGGGEVARYVSRYGEDRVRSVVFAAAITPYMAKTEDNPRGPVSAEAAGAMKSQLVDNRDQFFEQFTFDFFAANGTLKVTEAQREEAVVLCKQSDERAAVECMEAFGTTDFRMDLLKISVPTLIIHGDSDAIVPFEGSGQLTHTEIPQSEMVVLKDAPHGCNVSHVEEFNKALISFAKYG